MFQTVRGMRDFLPEKKEKKDFIENSMKAVFEKYGFKPLQTPVVEDYRLLDSKGQAGQEIKKEIYYFKDQADRELGLRFDLTVPLSRVVASNPNLSKPFKRYQIARVYRYDRPQAGRYREFTQADVDTIGSDSLVCDFECIAIAVEVMQRLGFKNFYVRINDRQLLEDIAKASGVSQGEVVDAFRTIDKLDKIDWSGVEEEMKEKKIDTKILGYIKKNDLKDIEKIFKEKKMESKGLANVKELLSLVKAQGLEKFVKVDLSLARGLEYYTGMVFEVMCEGGKSSTAGGGRFDKLVEALGGAKTPAVGISFGVDRILDLLDEKLKLENKTKLFLIPVGKELAGEVLSLAQRLRGEGVNVEMDLMERGISKNMNYANKQGFPFIAVIGENELKAKEFKLKEMKTGREEKFKFSETNKLKKRLE
jgi:histidyl-tRNA synthetase